MAEENSFDMFYDTDGDDMVNKRSGPQLINLIKTQCQIIKSILTFGSQKEGNTAENNEEFSDEE